MFTVLSNTRKSNLYLIVALAVAVLALTSFAVMPAMMAAKPVSIPVTGNSEVTSDYFLRHPELNISAAPAIDSDFYQRHPQLSAPAGITIDMMRYRTRNQKLSSPTTDLSDYFQRHGEPSAPSMATPLVGSLETPGLACESPVDCR